MTSPNENIVHIEAVEGLLHQVNEHLGQVTPSYPLQETAKKAAIEDINSVQTGSLFNLRTLCEGDS